MNEEGSRPGLLNPNFARKSRGERWIAFGLELRGIEKVVGIRPVVRSSVGSRTSGGLVGTQAGGLVSDGERGG